MSTVAQNETFFGIINIRVVIIVDESARVRHRIWWPSSGELEGQVRPHMACNVIIVIINRGSEVTLLAALWLYCSPKVSRIRTEGTIIEL